MPLSQTCLDARAALAEIRRLREQLGAAFEAAGSGSDAGATRRAREARDRLEAEIAKAREPLAVAETEKLFGLRRQYEFQVGILKGAGFVESRTERDADGIEREVLFATGIDGKEYRVPSLAEIVRRFNERKELFRMKADQGFVKLVLVPFGMSLDEMIARLKAYISVNKGRIKLIGGDDGQNDSNQTEAEHVDPWNDYTGADASGHLIYDPKEFSVSHGGKTKREILTKNDGGDGAGWRILLLQADEGNGGVSRIPRAGQGTARGTKSLRMGIETGKSANAFLRCLRLKEADRGSSPYLGESGMTPEDWIIAFISHFEETSELMDAWDFCNEEAVVALLTGAYLPGIDNVPQAHWSLRDQKACLFGGKPMSISKDMGTRHAVRM